MKNNAPKEALTRAVNRAIAEGSPVFTEMKTETKHTPGPWMVLDDGQQSLRVGPEHAPNGDIICMIEPCDPQVDGGGNFAIDLANARLIASAPRLLEERDALLAALRDLEDCASLVLERWENGDLADAVNSLRVDRDMARDAIAKATGKDGAS